LTGSLPRGDDVIEGLDVPPVGGGKWGDMRRLQFLSLKENRLTGTLPPQFVYGVGDSLESLDLGSNNFKGTLPSAIGKFKKLIHFFAPYNDFEGTFPVEMKYMNVNLLLNFTENRLYGSVPRLVCASGPKQRESKRYRILGCDMIICPGGTFHRDGAAGTDGSCRICHGLTGQDARILGRTTCPGSEYVHGDLDGDGEISEREILRLLYVYTGGQYWGNQFSDWADPFNDPCELNGITCVNNQVAKIDMSDASMCSNGERKPGLVDQCRGLPSELAMLANLEVLTLSRRQFLRGSIPTEFGKLGRLKYFDISNCPNMRGTLPTELGLLTNLKVLAVGGCRFNGTIPEHLFNLTRVEKLHLSMNLFSGQISSGIRKLNSIKELMISRTLITGSLPTELGILSSIENLEMYGNQLTGKIPSSLGKCTNLKRIGKNLFVLHSFGQKLRGSSQTSFFTIRLIQQQTNWNDSRNTVSVAITTNPARQTKSIDRNDLSQFRQASIFILV
jgi:Leucine-rich repeat (LRR) protein